MTSNIRPKCFLKSSNMKQLSHCLPDSHKHLLCPLSSGCAALKGCSVSARPRQLMDSTLMRSGAVLNIFGCRVGKSRVDSTDLLPREIKH